MEKEYKGLKENMDRFKNDLLDEKTKLLFSIAYKQGYDEALTLNYKTMTPQEKAVSLVDWFMPHMPPTTSKLSHAKKCAIKVCEESIKNFEDLHKPEYCAFDAFGERKFTYKGEYETHMTGYDMQYYWEEVIEQIKAIR